jgi:hypothetical protein
MKANLRERFAERVTSRLVDLINLDAGTPVQELHESLSDHFQVRQFFGSYVVQHVAPFAVRLRPGLSEIRAAHITRRHKRNFRTSWRTGPSSNAVLDLVRIELPCEHPNGVKDRSRVVTLIPTNLGFRLASLTLVSEAHGAPTKQCSL